MTESATEEIRTARVEFIEYHRPGLPPGTYTITVEQDVTGPTITETFATTRQFTVAGERFTLQPADVYAVFPPDGSLGEHSGTLPHIALSRSTLPWERRADGGETPWLALLLLYEEESLGGTIEKQAFLNDYAAAENEAAWNYLLDQRIGWLRPLAGQSEAALIVSKGSRAAASLDGDFTAAAGRLEEILDRYRSPQVVTLGSLKAGSDGAINWPELHIDQNQNADSDKLMVIDIPKPLLATVMPTADELNLLAHVRRAEDAQGQRIEDERAVIIGSRLPKKNGISIAHLISVEGRYSNGSFDYRGAQEDTYIRLISLKSWRFACADPEGDFTGMLTNLDRAPSTLRLPHSQDAAAEGYLSPGYVPVPHRLRQAGSTVSWYRGPLITRAAGAEIRLPAQTAGALVRYDPALGMFDVSYAAAWELGRLLALQSKQLSVSLYNWKRANAQALRTAETWLLHPGWVEQDAADSGQLPPEIVAWFDDLRLLRGVPFNYLVPDERMLPPESIRFFQVDHPWIDCLIDGAFSIGRLTGKLKDVDVTQKGALARSLAAHGTRSGFLLRSSVVAGWPGLLVDAYAPSDSAPDATKLALLRMDRLSSDVLLCLFAGEAAEVAIHQKPETLHFGLANLEGEWKKEGGVVDIGQLAETLGIDAPITSAGFASRVVKGVPRVLFKLA